MEPGTENQVTMCCTETRVLKAIVSLVATGDGETQSISRNYERWKRATAPIGAMAHLALKRLASARTSCRVEQILRTPPFTS